MTKTTVLQPGILVSLKTSVRGGVEYVKVDLDPGEKPKVGEIKRWETTKLVEDPEENERAGKVRSRAADRIRALCAKTSFGLLCSQAKEDKLDAAIAEAQNIVDAFNNVAICTEVQVHVLKGRIAETDDQAARAIASDVTDLLREMEEGIRKVDVKAIREAASRALKLGTMLDQGQVGKVTEAVQAARKAARAIAAKVVKGGEDAQVVLEEIDISPIETARIAFLDYESVGSVAEGEELPAIDVRRIAELELGLEGGEAAPEEDPGIEGGSGIEAALASYVVRELEV